MYEDLEALLGRNVDLVSERTLALSVVNVLSKIRNLSMREQLRDREQLEHQINKRI